MENTHKIILSIVFIVLIGAVIGANIQREWAPIVLSAVLTALFCAYIINWGISQKEEKEVIIREKTSPVPPQQIIHQLPPPKEEIKPLSSEKAQAYEALIKDLWTLDIFRSESSSSLEETPHSDPADWFNTKSQPQFLEKKINEPETKESPFLPDARVLIWASPSVLKAYWSLLQMLQSTHPDKEGLRDQIVQILWEIRSELDADNSELSTQDLKNFFKELKNN